MLDLLNLIMNTVGLNLCVIFMFCDLISLRNLDNFSFGMFKHYTIICGNVSTATVVSY